jgi:hypothetical protein
LPSRSQVEKTEGMRLMIEKVEEEQKLSLKVLRKILSANEAKNISALMF